MRCNYANAGNAVKKNTKARDYWLDHWSLIIGYWSLVIEHRSFQTDKSRWLCTKERLELAQNSGFAAFLAESL